MICYIVGAGEFHGGFIPQADDFVIAADGGYTHLTSKGIRCDMLIGDMDSLNNVPSGIETVIHPVMKDETDTFLAYTEGVKRGYTDFEIYGGVGGRDDHTFANLSLLLYMKNHSHKGRLIGKGSYSTVIKNEELTVSGRVGAGFSVFAIGGEAHGVSIEGAKYKCSDITITPDFPLGVSNSFESESVKIGVKNGSLLIMIES